MFNLSKTPICNCCKQQFCSSSVKEEKISREVLQKWEKVKKTCECPQCGMITHNVFWLRSDGIECCNCR